MLPENCDYVQKIVSRKRALLKELTIDPMRLAVGKMVGSGQFGQVFVGTLNPKAVNVAIKMVKAAAGASAANEELAEEAAVTGTFNHPNVIKALGVYQEDKCWRLVLEFCGKGALQTLLSEFATAGAAAGQMAAGTAVAYGLPRLLRYTTELASAMQYLSGLKFVHRDLAARNALVTDDDVAKLADFGMSRQTGATDSYVAVTQRPQPLRWMAPESIELMTFASETDVWSFGVMAWEIFAMGGQPYKGVSNLMIYKELVVDGTRLECPVGCPDPVYTILAATWQLVPGERPSFARLHEQLLAVQRFVADAAAACQAPPVTDAALRAVIADYRLMGVGVAAAAVKPPPAEPSKLADANGALPVVQPQPTKGNDESYLYTDPAPVPVLDESLGGPASGTGQRDQEHEHDRADGPGNADWVASPGTTPYDYVNNPWGVRSAKREDRLQRLLGEPDALEPRDPVVQDILGFSNEGLEI